MALSFGLAAERHSSTSAPELCRLSKRHPAAAPPPRAAPPACHTSFGHIGALPGGFIVCYALRAAQHWCVLVRAWSNSLPLAKCTPFAGRRAVSVLQSLLRMLLPRITPLTGLVWHQLGSSALAFTPIRAVSSRSRCITVIAQGRAWARAAQTRGIAALLGARASATHPHALARAAAQRSPMPPAGRKRAAPAGAAAPLPAPGVPDSTAAGGVSAAVAASASGGAASSSGMAQPLRDLGELIVGKASRVLDFKL